MARIKPFEKNGVLVIGFIDRASPVGQVYQKFKEHNVFYCEATFYSVDEVVICLKNAGFQMFRFSQTVFNQLKDIKAIEPDRKGYGEGSFVVIRAIK